MILGFLVECVFQEETLRHPLFRARPNANDSVLFSDCRSSSSVRASGGATGEWRRSLSASASNRGESRRPNGLRPGIGMPGTLMGSVGTFRNPKELLPGLAAPVGLALGLACGVLVSLLGVDLLVDEERKFMVLTRGNAGQKKLARKCARLFE